MERGHILVLWQRQDIDRERKSDRGFSSEYGGASTRVIELHTTGPYTHTRGCGGLASFFEWLSWVFHSLGLDEFVVIKKVTYFLTIKSISHCCTGFPILGFSGGFHTQNNSVNIVMWCCDLFLSFYIPLHTVKDIHVWLSIEICMHCLALAWILKKNLYGIRALVS